MQVNSYQHRPLIQNAPIELASSLDTTSSLGLWVDV